ncbi:MAG: DUF2974 domain-containing protein [Bacillota bacterium]|nr:DUF2974 domain-containing protein [Bacillota bacterium]
MANLFDYLLWRGDLTLDQSPFNDVDSLALSAVSYVFFEGIVPEAWNTPLSFGRAAELYFQRPKEKQLARAEEDIRLFREMAACRRYKRMGLCGYVSRLDKEAEKQFSALTLLLEDGTAYIAFRGTDRSIVGWKEDFNMSFRDTVPAQVEAAAYLEAAAKALGGVRLRVGGHSKGGNLAVYAAAMAPKAVQDILLSVDNHDGPGFHETMLARAGYQSILPRVQTFLPQSSVIGMLLEHEEAYTVVKSTETGVMQHDPYSWEVQGPDFIRMEGLTEQSRFLDKTLKRWLNEVGENQRELFVDAVYAAVTEGQKNGEELSPRMVIGAIQALKDEDAATKTVIGNSVKQLLQAAAETAAEYAAALPKKGRRE